MCFLAARACKADAEKLCANTWSGPMQEGFRDGSIIECLRCVRLVRVGWQLLLVRASLTRSSCPLCLLGHMSTTAVTPCN